MLCVMVFVTLNIFTVKIFGEMEFRFAIIKIVAIVAIIIAGATLATMHYPSSATDQAGLDNIWQHGGPQPICRHVHSDGIAGVGRRRQFPGADLGVVVRQ